MLNNRQGLRFSNFHAADSIISVENLLGAWKEFVRGKRKKKDVQEFSANLMDNIFLLHIELKSGIYEHGRYHAFKVADPKPRDIHKAFVRDRLLHHAIYRQLYPLFDQTWISDSYSCRNTKGTHRAMNQFRHMANMVSKNNTGICWILKCDIKKFFASIDHGTLLSILEKYLGDGKTLGIIKKIVRSFYSTEIGKGLPLGNLTSQMLVNIYMNEFDQFMKHRMKARHYIRYADDFVVLSEDKKYLETLIPKISYFLSAVLSLSLHPTKVSINTLSSGIDFLGWVHFFDHRVLRTSTKKRMIRNLSKNRSKNRVQSYTALLSHGNAHNLSTEYLQDSEEYCTMKP